MSKLPNSRTRPKTKPKNWIRLGTEPKNRIRPKTEPSSRIRPETEPKNRTKPKIQSSRARIKVQKVSPAAAGRKAQISRWVCERKTDKQTE